MSRSIRIFPEIDGPIASIPAPRESTAIVGYGRGAYIGEVRGPYQSLSECGTEMDNLSGGAPNDLDEDGHSAVYRWVREFMANGARRVYVTEPTVSALQTLTMTGDGTQRSFDLIVDKTGGAGALTLSPIPGTLHIVITAVVQVENVDYIVDWSQGIVHFAVAPAIAANNITVSFLEYTAAAASTAFAFLESVPITITGGAYFASDNGAYSLVGEIRDHLNAAATLRNYRKGYMAGYYLDVANVSALAYNNDYLSYWANRSGNFNDNLVDPTVSWREFIDPSAVIAGIDAARNPWVSLHEKVTTNLNQVSDWNSTDITTFNAAFVNHFATDSQGSVRAKNGWNAETGAATYRFVDSVGLWIYAGNTIYNDLLVKNIIGNIQVDRAQVLTMEQVMMNTLIQMYQDGAIGDPRLLFTTHNLNPISSQLIDAVKELAANRTPAQEAYIQAAQVSRAEDVRIYYDGLGSLHSLDIYLGGR